MALNTTLAAHGSVIINDSGVTARRLTDHGMKLEAHEAWGFQSWHGGAAATIIGAVKKLDFDAARWGSGPVVYPRMTIEKVRGEKRWRVGVLTSGGWGLEGEATSINQAYDLARARAAEMGKPCIIEDRPKRLWR